MDELLGLNNLDLLVDLKNCIGKRVKLDAVARPTLKVGKSADGLMALKWYKEFLEGDASKLQMIADYCTQDVDVTRDVYLHGINQKEILYEDRHEGIKPVAVSWAEETPVEPEPDSVQLSF